MYGFSGVLVLTLCAVSPTQVHVDVGTVPSWWHSQRYAIALLRTLFCCGGHSERDWCKIYDRRYVNESRLKELQSERFKNYWLRRKKKGIRCSEMEPSWIDKFTRHFLNGWWRGSLEMYTEFVMVFMLTFRIVCVPLVFSQQFFSPACESSLRMEERDCGVVGRCWC